MHKFVYFCVKQGLTIKFIFFMINMITNIDQTLIINLLFRTNNKFGNKFIIKRNARRKSRNRNYCELLKICKLTKKIKVKTQLHVNYQFNKFLNTN